MLYVYKETTEKWVSWVPGVGLWSVIVAFPGHTQFLYPNALCITNACFNKIVPKIFYPHYETMLFLKMHLEECCDDIMLLSS